MTYSTKSLYNMGKRASASYWVDQAKFIIDGLTKNKVTGGEALRASAIGAISTALAGAGIGAITGKKGKRRSRAIKGAIIGAVAGGLGGPVYAQLRKYLDGVPFDNSRFEKAPHRKGDTVYLGVGGSANGEDGNSYFADSMRGSFGNNVVMKRHVDDIDKTYNDLTGKGYKVVVVGHSSGGSTVARFLDKHPEAFGYIIDPVGWTGRRRPKNAVYFTTDKSTRHGGPFENTIADVGGRWNYEGADTVVFKGSHSDQLKNIIKDYVRLGVRPEDQYRPIPDYVTSEFGTKREGGS